MGMKKNRILQISLESQLSLLKGRLEHPDASQWRQLGKMTQDFGLWLERARPLIPCAARLISLRVDQICEQLLPERDSEKAVRQLLALLDEAGRHLSDPGSPIQVIDVDREEKAFLLGKDLEYPYHSLSEGKVGLPFDMFDIPAWLQPDGDPSTPFLFIIPN